MAWNLELFALVFFAPLHSAALAYHACRLQMFRPCSRLFISNWSQLETEVSTNPQNYVS